MCKVDNSGMEYQEFQISSTAMWWKVKMDSQQSFQEQHNVVLCWSDHSLL